MGLQGGVSVWIAATRPKTLPAAISPVLVGASEAYRVGAFDVFPIIVCMAFAVLVQIGTNMANDYFDCIKGADTEERLGPERLVAAGKVSPKVMLYVAIGVFLLAFCIGLSLVWYRGWELLVVGVVSILFGYGYTGGPYPLAYHGLGDVFVIFFFGIVATAGTFYAVTGELSGIVLVQGLALGLLASNILVINNLRDRETDATAGKRTLIVRFGVGFGVSIYRIQYLISLGALLLIWRQVESIWVLLPFVTLPLGLKASVAVAALQGRALNPLLGKSAAVLMLFSVSLSVALLLAA